ncbi:uncharacterized protein [Macaca nemestrina]|uniref:uncharacterized protein isoform X2 n=1 Tax=Macaca nemestrina TaxID=9545 RepID=UPI0039B9A018
MPECVEQEQLETVAFSRKKFLNLPLRRYQKVQDASVIRLKPDLTFSLSCLKPSTIFLSVELGCNLNCLESQEGTTNGTNFTRLYE